MKRKICKKTPKIEITGTSSFEKKEFIATTVDTFQMDEEETSKMIRGGLTPEQCREYERRMDMENKRRQMDEGDV